MTRAEKRLREMTRTLTDIRAGASVHAALCAALNRGSWEYDNALLALRALLEHHYALTDRRPREA